MLVPKLPKLNRHRNKSGLQYKNGEIITQRQGTESFCLWLRVSFHAFLKKVPHISFYPPERSGTGGGKPVILVPITCRAIGLPWDITHHRRTKTNHNWCTHLLIAKTDSQPSGSLGLARVMTTGTFPCKGSITSSTGLDRWEVGLLITRWLRPCLPRKWRLIVVSIWNVFMSGLRYV